MEKGFLDWYETNEKRFAHAQFNEKEVAYSAWLEGRKPCEHEPVELVRKNQKKVMCRKCNAWLKINNCE